MRKDKLTLDNFVIDKNDNGWYFKRDNWNNSVVGYFNTKKLAKEAAEEYIDKYNSGVDLSSYALILLENETSSTAE